MKQEKLPEFNNIMEQKLFALQKTDELIVELHNTKQAFDTPEEIRRLTDLLKTAKEAIKDPQSLSEQMKIFYSDIAVFDSVEDYIRDLKEKADVQIQTFIDLRKMIENLRV